VHVACQALGGPGPYYFQVTAICGSTVSAKSAEFSFSCSQEPQIDLTFDPKPACVGEQVCVNYTGTPPLSNFLSTKIDWGDGNVTSNPSQQECHNYGKVGNFDISYTGTVASGSGCSDTTVKTAFVEKRSFTINITGPFHTCDTVSTYCIDNPSADIGYDWWVNGGNILDNRDTCVDIEWNYPIGGKVFATHPCTNDTAEFKVHNCCGASDPNAVIVYDTTEQFFLNKYGTLNVSTTDEIYINGILTIENALTFINTNNINMGPKAKIKVEQASTFNLNSSHIQAGCDTMWDGTYVCSKDNSVAMLNGSIMEDAENAIVSINYGDFNVSNSTLDRNWKHIKVVLDGSRTCGISDVSGKHPGVIRSTDFISTGGNLMAPHDNDPQTHIGVQVTSPSILNTPFSQPIDITIGDPGDPSFQNTFDGLDLGIKSAGSQIEVYNNEFMNITGFSVAPDQKGTSVYNQGNFEQPTSLIVGGTGSNEKNTFEQGYRGVYNEGSAVMEVINNDFDNFTRMGVTSTFNSLSSITINRNNMQRMKNGIKMFRNPLADIEIQRNNIDLIPALFPPNTSTHGIIVHEINPNVRTNPTVDIRFNNISDVNRKGVWVRNVRGSSSSSNPTIHSNTVQVNTPFFIPNPANRSGIRIDNCKFAKVTENTAYSSTSNSDVVRGIEVQFSESPLIKCNTTRHVDWGISHRNFNRPAFNKANTMKNTHRGFVIWDDGNAGPQGEIINPSNPKLGITWDNRWNNNTMDLWSTDGGGIASNGAFTPFHLRVMGSSGGPYFVPPAKTGAKTGCSNGPCFKMTRTLYNHPNEVDNSIITCGCSIPCIVAQEKDKRERIIRTGREVAQNQIGFTDQVTEQRWMTRHSLFHTLRADTTLMDEDTTGVLRQFHDSVEVSTMGQLCMVCHNAFELTPADSAAQRNQVKNALNNISPTNAQERHLKEVANIHIETMAQGDRTFNTAQRTILWDIAKQCPTEGGQAVFYARSIYHNMINDTINFEQMCLSGSSASKRSTKTSTPQDSLQSQDDFILYPTVLKQNSMIQVTAPKRATLRIYNTTGKQVSQHQIQKGENRLSIEQLQTGVYIYKIVRNGTPKQQGKVAVVK
jgi:hypothetical protein